MTSKEPAPADIIVNGTRSSLAAFPFLHHLPARTRALPAAFQDRQEDEEGAAAAMTPALAVRFPASAKHSPLPAPGAGPSRRVPRVAGRRAADFIQRPSVTE